jgi:hypothetical protein
MTYIQAVTPTPNIPCKPGWCLQYVRQAFGLPAIHPTATAAWEASKTQHRDRNFPAGVSHAVWYGLDKEPAGHVVLRMPDGSCYSTSDLSTVPHHHPDLADLEAYYARYGMTLTYRGWTEDVQGIPVITNSTISAQGAITPQEDDMTPEQWKFVQAVLTSLSDNVATKKDLKDTEKSVNWSTQQQVEAVGRVTQQLILDNASPADVAASIPESIAAEVVKLLTERLAK